MWKTSLVAVSLAVVLWTSASVGQPHNGIANRRVRERHSVASYHAKAPASQPAEDSDPDPAPKARVCSGHHCEGGCLHAPVAYPPPVPCDPETGNPVYPPTYEPGYWSPNYPPYYPYYYDYRDPSRDWHHTPKARGDGGFSPWLTYGYDSPYGNDRDAAFRRGRYDASDYMWYISSARAEQLIRQSRQMTEQGMTQYKGTQYERAAVTWLGATELNHADGASRIHAGNALIALGQYDDAYKVLTRGFELVPNLAYRQYDLRDDYGQKDDFDAHIEALKQFVTQHPNDGRATGVLGYAIYFTKGPGAARLMLERSAQLESGDSFVTKLLQVSRMVGGTNPDKAGRSTSKKILLPSPLDNEDHSLPNALGNSRIKWVSTREPLRP